MTDRMHITEARHVADRVRRGETIDFETRRRAFARLDQNASNKDDRHRVRDMLAAAAGKDFPKRIYQ